MASRYLNNITINDAYTLPSADGTSGQAIVTDGAGNLTFSTVAAGTADAALKISLTVKNVSGGTLNAGTIVRAAPTANPPSGNTLEVDIADNSAASTMPAIGILTDSIADQAEGDAIAFGRASGFSTSGYTEGDQIWVGSSGAFVGTKPTGSNLIQRFGQIIKVHSTNGSIEVFGAGRTNDVPNLSQGKIWVGTATNTAESTLIDVDETNNILTVNGKIYYGNIFAQESDLPSATTYHGMFAHVHGTGYAYYAHAGAWVKLAKLDDINDSTLTVTAGTGLSGGGTFTTNQSADSAVTVNLANTAVTPGTYGDANNTPQITIDQQGRITTATTVQTAGSGSGGGGGTVTVEKNVYTANGQNAGFNTSTAIVNENNVQVYINGVYQSKDNYTTSGSTVTLSTPPANGTSVELIHMVSVSGVIARDSFTGNGSTTAYTLSLSITNENATQVYIDGVYQSKDNYTTSGSILTFSTSPPNGAAIEVVHIKAVNASSLNQNNFTGNGSNASFNLSQSIDDENKTFVFIQGVYQEKSTYSISGTTLTFTTPPQNGYTIEVMAFSSITIGNQTAAGLDWQSSIKTASFPATAGKGYFVDSGSAAITVTLPSSPSVGDEVGLVDYGANAATNNITITSSDDIENSADDKVINYDKGAVNLVYSGAAKGWLVSSAANETATALGEIPLTVDYLVVAGGGGGGAAGAGSGGGGAGGLRTSYGNTQGGGQTAESSLTLSVSTNYTVTVGGGGSGGTGTGYGNNGTQGQNSTFSTITSTGGGFGSSNNVTGGTGGSGGGGNAGYATAGGAATSSPVQGYAGGDGIDILSPQQRYGSGGGGGAGAVGGDGNVSGGNDESGDGGDGIAVNILNTTNAATASVGQVSGSDVYYAGGGGGGAGYVGTALPGSGGTGGGGAGGVGGSVAASTYNGFQGTDNTGGGGGGGAGLNATHTAVNGGDGGSGIVILRYPAAYAIAVGSGIIEASGSPFTEGTDKVSVFTGGTGTISFS